MMNSNNDPVADGGDEIITLQEKVRDLLLRRKIKLWKPPYVDHPTGASVGSSLEQLVETWTNDDRVLIPDEDLSRTDTQEQVLQALRDWQQHALEKLRSQQLSSASSPTSVVVRVATTKSIPSM